MPSTWTVLISLHAIAASYALIFGAVNLIRRTKGGRLHRIVGRIWAAAMYVVILTSFGIRTIDGGFNWLHGLSVLTFCTLTAGLFAAYKRNTRAHRSFEHVLRGPLQQKFATDPDWRRATGPAPRGSP